MAKKKSATAVVEPEEELDLDELDSDEGTEEKATSSKQEVTFGVADLCKLLAKKTGKEYTTRDMRTLIRKMAREDNPRIQREIVPGNRSRYDWPGPNDPEVKAIIKAVLGGELEQGKKEALAKLKENKAKKTAAETNGKTTKAGKKGKKAKAAAPVEEVEDEVEDIEFEDEED